MSMLRLSQAARGPAGGALRRMSTAALPKVAPIKMYGIAGRYTNALYAAAANKSELLLVEADLKLFKETMATSAALRNFVIDPSISRSKKVAGVASLCTEAGACESTKNALSALAEGGRMSEIKKVIDMYGQLLSAAKGELTAVITSAEPLEKAQVDEVVGALSAMVSPGPLGPSPPPPRPAHRRVAHMAFLSWASGRRLPHPHRSRRAQLPRPCIADGRHRQGHRRDQAGPEPDRRYDGDLRRQVHRHVGRLADEAAELAAHGVSAPPRAGGRELFIAMRARPSALCVRTQGEW